MSAVLMEQELDKELNLAEAADELHTSPFTVRRRILAGLIPARREGREYRVKRRDLEDYKRRTIFIPGKQQE
jgi:excisionase family DNA binding protein